jgi:hypothetical protein
MFDKELNHDVYTHISGLICVLLKLLKTAEILINCDWKTADRQPEQQNKTSLKPRVHPPM